MIKGTIGAVAAAVALLVAPASALAAPIIFDQVEQGGTVTQSGSNYTGTNIIFEFVTYDADGPTPLIGAYCGMPTFSGLFLTGTTANCLLNFSTATNTFTLTSASDGSGGYLPLVDQFGNPIAGTAGVLVQGTFSTFGLDGSGTEFTATGIDTKNAALLAYLGVTATNFTFNNTDIRTLPDGTVTQADLTNTAVPEPGVLALFGLGLLGVGRKLTRRSAA